MKAMREREREKMLSSRTDPQTDIEYSAEMSSETLTWRDMALRFPFITWSVHTCTYKV